MTWLSLTTLYTKINSLSSFYYTIVKKHEICVLYQSNFLFYSISVIFSLFSRCMFDFFIFSLFSRRMFDFFILSRILFSFIVISQFCICKNLMFKGSNPDSVQYEKNEKDSETRTHTKKSGGP